MIRNRFNNARNSGYHGLTLEDVAGSIRKDISYWAIDESGNPSRKRTEDGKTFTVAAVTELSDIDYDRLLDGVPLYDGEVHFNPLYHNNPDICIRLMTDLGRENILVVYKTVQKRWKPTSKRDKHVPVDELYLFSILSEMLNAIEIIDHSDTIIVTYDENSNFRKETCSLLWGERCILVLGRSEANKLIQMADMCASSIGKFTLPGKYSDPRYLEKIAERTVDISNGLASCRSTWRSPVTNEDKRYRYKTASAEEKSDDKDGTVRNKNKKCNRITSCTQHQVLTCYKTTKRYRYKTASAEERSDDKEGSVRSRNKKCNRITSCRSTRYSPVTDDKKQSKYKTIRSKTEQQDKKGQRLVSCTQHQSFAPVKRKKQSEYKSTSHEAEAVA